MCFRRSRENKTYHGGSFGNEGLHTALPLKLASTRLSSADKIATATIQYDHKDEDGNGDDDGRILAWGDLTVSIQCEL